MGILGISYFEFFALSPKEFYYAIKAVNEKEKLERHHQYQVARYTAVSIINMTSTILKKQITDPRELTQFPWEDNIKEQTDEQLQGAVRAMALKLGASTRVKENPNDPPLHLAPQHLK